MKVSNPLTIIAIFAGLAETLATVALINLPKELQDIFVYFVMAFPSSIVIFFFLVLYFKNNVLYAPSDYSDPEHYLKINGGNIRELLSDELSKLELGLKSKIDNDESVMKTSETNSMIEENPADMVMTISKELLEPTLQLLVFQLLEKPASERDKIIESIKNEKTKAMLVSVLSKIKAYVGEKSYNKPMQPTANASAD